MKLFSLRLAVFSLIFLAFFVLGRVSAENSSTNKSVPQKFNESSLPISSPLLSRDTTQVAAYTCSNALMPRLSVGRLGLVHANDPRPVNLRLAPGVESEKIGQFAVGTEFIVVDGPFCNEAMNWWQVKNLTTEQEGYLSEGSSFYFVIPL